MLFGILFFIKRFCEHKGKLKYLNMIKKNKIIKYLIIFSIFFLSISAAQAAFNPLKDPSGMKTQAEALADQAEFGTTNEGEGIGLIMATVIKAFLGLLGIIFIVLMITAGYKWMTAGGNEEKIKEAQEMIKKAIIGLIIIVAAYAITHFIFNALPWGGTGGPGFTG